MNPSLRSAKILALVALRESGFQQRQNCGRHLFWMGFEAKTTILARQRVAMVSPLAQSALAEIVRLYSNPASAAKRLSIPILVNDEAESPRLCRLAATV
jgi:hypothetical protein